MSGLSDSVTPAYTCWFRTNTYGDWLWPVARCRLRENGGGRRRAQSRSLICPHGDSGHAIRSHRGAGPQSRTEVTAWRRRCPRAKVRDHCRMATPRHLPVDLTMWLETKKRKAVADHPAVEFIPVGTRGRQREVDVPAGAASGELRGAEVRAAGGEAPGHGGAGGGGRRRTCWNGPQRTSACSRDAGRQVPAPTAAAPPGVLLADRWGGRRGRVPVHADARTGTRVKTYEWIAA